MDNVMDSQECAKVLKALADNTRLKILEYLFNGESSVSEISDNIGTDFSQVTYPANHTPTALMARDLNEDGFPDILVASLSGTDFRIVLGDGRGGVLRSIEFAGTYAAVTAALADLNGNGLEDLLIGSLFSKRVAVFKNVSLPGDG